jgi:hypothetical protein
MARTIELLEDRLAVRLSGITRLAAVTSDFEIPYSAIRSVSAEPLEISFWRMWKWAGANWPLPEIMEGHFRHDGKWYFLSFEDRNKTITLELEGFKMPFAPWPGKRGTFGIEPTYHAVVLGVDNPQETANAIAARCGLKPAAATEPRHGNSGASP